MTVFHAWRGTEYVKGVPTKQGRGCGSFSQAFGHKGLRLRVFPEKNVFAKGIPCGQKRSGIMDFAKSVARNVVGRDGGLCWASPAGCSRWLTYGPSGATNTLGPGQCFYGAPP